jgi:hypothetical protein
MRIFISYASEDRDQVEPVHMALVGAGHQTFFDKAALPPGNDYHGRIHAAVMASDAFVFMVSPHSVAAGAYTLTELKIAKGKWPRPAGHVLPVMAVPMAYDKLPAYLGAVTVLEPEGNLAAEVALAVGALSAATPAPPAASPVAPQCTLHSVQPLHNVPVATPGGMAPGMQIQIHGQVRGGSGRSFQLVVRFAMQGGPPLQANMQELVYRDLSGLVATGTPPRPLSLGDTALAESVLIPYYALNMMPSGGMAVHHLLLTAFAYLDNQLLAQSVPVPFMLRW